MNKKLILCAPIAMVLASCSTTRMGHLVPESRDTDFEGVAIQGWNTGSVVTYGKNYKTGYMETANVTVYQDSGIDNTAKLAHAVGSVATGTGSVMQGYGAIRYADAMQDYASAYKRIAHDGLKYDITSNVTGDGGGSGSGGGVTNVNVSGGNATATGGAGGNATNTNCITNTNTNTNTINNNGMGGMGGMGGGGCPPMGGGCD